MASSLRVESDETLQSLLAYGAELFHLVGAHTAVVAASPHAFALVAATLHQ